MLLVSYKRESRLRSERFLIHLVNKVRKSLEPTAEQLQLSTEHIQVVAKASWFEGSTFWKGGRRELFPLEERCCLVLGLKFGSFESGCTRDLCTFSFLTKEEVEAMHAGLLSPLSLCESGAFKLAFISNTGFRYWLVRKRNKKGFISSLELLK